MSKKNKSSSLTNLQRAFIEHYFTCGLNGTEAVIQAGYKVSGRDNARRIASENLNKPHIKAAIDARLEETAMSANEILYRLTEQARASHADFWDISEFGSPKINLKKAQERGKLHLLKKIKITQSEHGSNIEIELHDSQTALIQLGRYWKLWTDRIEVMDWKAEAVQAINSGEIDYQDLAEELGTDLATELFVRAGVPIRLQSDRD